MKKIFFIIVSLLLLTSCFNKEKNENIQVNNTVSQTGITVNSSESKKLDPEELVQKRKELFLSGANIEEKQLFLEYDKAKEKNDKIKEEELKSKIKELENTKRAELDKAVKDGDNEKAKKLRKEMRIFSVDRF